MLRVNLYNIKGQEKAIVRKDIECYDDTLVLKESIVFVILNS